MDGTKVNDIMMAALRMKPLTTQPPLLERDKVALLQLPKKRQYWTL